MKKLIAIAALLSLTGCAVYVPAARVGVYTPNVSVTVGYGEPGYRHHYYGSPYDSGPFGYSREVQERGSYYSPPVGNRNCEHRHR